MKFTGSVVKPPTNPANRNRRGNNSHKFIRIMVALL